MSEIIENAEKAPERSKPSIKEILSKYRHLGLPNAKRFRRRTRLEQAEAVHQADLLLVQAVMARLRAYEEALKVFENESNWAVREIDQPNYQGTRIEWAADEDPFEVIKKARTVGA